MIWWRIGEGTRPARRSEGAREGRHCDLAGDRQDSMGSTNRQGYPQEIYLDFGKVSVRSLRTMKMIAKNTL